MAENTPITPAGALPPKPAEAAKVQPKKETVRINLPPKPTAAPTIKIPAPSAVAAATPAPAAPVAAAPAAAAPAAPAVARPAAAPAPRPAPVSRPMPVAAGISGLDTGLAIGAAVLGVVAVVRVFMLTQM